MDITQVELTLAGGYKARVVADYTEGQFTVFEFVAPDGTVSFSSPVIKADSLDYAREIQLMNQLRSIKP